VTEAPQVKGKSMHRTILPALLIAPVLFGQAEAQTAYPSRPVRIVVPSSAGGGTDSVARLIAQHLSAKHNRSFYIENKPGAGSLIGVQAVAQAAADGYTLLAGASTVTTLQVVHKKMPFDIVRDFAPITQLVVLPQVLVAHPSVPAKSLAELVALAKQRPGELNYASAGLGTAPHLAMELLKSMAGIDLRHVPYRGVGPGLTDLLAGRVSVMIVNLLSAKPHIEAATLRALAVTSRRRASDLPEVPTLAEAGLAGYEALQWFGLCAPAGTPNDIVERLQKEIAEGLNTREIKDRLVHEGAEPVGSTPMEFAKLISDEVEKWNAVARAANIQPE
jgi:tripartite-type tricarboxylate transporter receptor subunit TctC